MTDDEQRGKLGSTRDEAERKRALTFAQRMRAYLMTGILVVAPISITFYLDSLIGK